MKANSFLVFSAFGIALYAVAIGKSESFVNNTVYGVAPSGQCIVASTSPGLGCTVTSSGIACLVIVYENGVGYWANAYKSPGPMPYCVLTIKRPS